MDTIKKINFHLHMKNSIKIWISLGFAVFGLLFSLLCRYIDGFADGYYTYIYRYLSVAVAFICNLVPFSVAEIVLYLLLLALLGKSIYGIFVISRKKGKRKSYWLTFGSNVIMTIATVFLLFAIFCGANYQKTSFIDKEGFRKDSYGAEELIQVCEQLTSKINTLRENEIEYDGIRQTSREVMTNLAKTYTSIKGYYPKPKYLLVPEVLSYQQVSGVYAFYTIEANYNSDMPEYEQPFTMCHELAHLKGVMKEEEANFVAYLACMNSDSEAFQYSGAMLAYTYCMNELYQYDQDAYIEIRGKLCENANKDIEEKHAFWNQYEGAISDLQTKLNDAYLKANSQASGVGSYNEVVALILNVSLMTTDGGM